MVKHDVNGDRKQPTTMGESGYTNERTGYNKCYKRAGGREYTTYVDTNSMLRKGERWLNWVSGRIEK